MNNLEMNRLQIKRLNKETYYIRAGTDYAYFKRNDN